MAVQKYSILMLAAGRGTRMATTQSKLLQPLGDTTLFGKLLQTVIDLPAEQIVIVEGFQGQALKKFASAYSEIIWVNQAKALGTGDAVRQALPVLTSDWVLILNADVPLLKPETLERLIENTQNQSADLGLLTAIADAPGELGRVIRDPKLGHITAIREARDATVQELLIAEINAGVYCVKAQTIQKFLSQMKSHNQQQEYYLTDYISWLVDNQKEKNKKYKIIDIYPQYHWEVMGINTQAERAQAERILQRECASQLMAQGVFLRDPGRLDVRGKIVSLGQDIQIDYNVLLEGEISLGDRVFIGPNVILKNCHIGADTQILANSIIEGAKIDAGCQIGPFARIRPGTELATRVKIGNFVEIKKSNVGPESKANHLSYIGDSEIGAHVNLGAGTITCNYNGHTKSKTIIQDRAFIGSGSQLIAPVTIGADSMIAAGTTVRKSVLNKQLVYNQKIQKTKVLTEREITTNIDN